MTYEEFKRLAKGMKSIWTDPKFLPDRYSIELWYEMLKDLTYEELGTAIQVHATKSKWLPTIAELREAVLVPKAGLKDWSEGWEQVVRAIGKYGAYQEWEALKSMDRITMLTVKRLGWKQICQSEQDTIPAIRANFRMIYEQMSEDTKEQVMLPGDVKGKLDMLAGKVFKEIE